MEEDHQAEVQNRIQYVSREISYLLALAPCILTVGIPPYNPEIWPTVYLEEIYGNLACADARMKQMLDQRLIAMKEKDNISEDENLLYNFESVKIGGGRKKQRRVSFSER